MCNPLVIIFHSHFDLNLLIHFYRPMMNDGAVLLGTYVYAVGFLEIPPPLNLPFCLNKHQEKNSNKNETNLKKIQ